MGAAAPDDVLRAQRVDFVIAIPGAAHAREAGDVEDGVGPAAGGHGGVRVAEIAAHGLDAQPVQLRVAPAAERAHRVAAADELLDNVETQEAPGPGDQRVHGKGLVRAGVT